MSQDFNATLNLPKTDFPMRAGLPKREPEMLKKWQEQDIYNEMLKVNEGHPRFNLHDGPPFSNGNIHMGHALNKCIKDFITRSYAMRGYYTPYIPGWDNHGMPIESAIIKEQKLNHKAMSVADFRSACHTATATSTRALSPSTGAPTTRPLSPRPRSSTRTTPSPPSTSSSPSSTTRASFLTWTSPS